ncbi:hypothetical protein C1Y63_03960 [Corynebacterium sp. 13CS0277]|uniref:hypothetical protein n=1 Tax=Corynebacterium sp. 13CS0277 TaxID=2071994 RepID=UPI000D0416E0|nr:hypothetical protein [Corynebacterium sp. 13CS0277]PRQ11805.1 hypothetical protein C1Y63_03960 [Corynebacterium sp. 13CS0277]
MIALIAGALVAAAALALLLLDRSRGAAPKDVAPAATAPEPTAAQQRAAALEQAHAVDADNDADANNTVDAVVVDEVAETSSPVDYEELDRPLVRDLVDADLAEDPAEGFAVPANPYTMSPRVADIDTDAEAALGAVPVYRTLAEEPTPVADADLDVDVDVTPQPETAVSPVATQEVETDTVEAAVDHDAAMDAETVESAEEPEVAEEPAPSTPKVQVLLAALPGAARRERKAWAEANGFDYVKDDPYLADEWSRGPATEPGTARDIVSGVACGYDCHVVDLGGRTLIAVRRAHASDVVVEMTRPGTPVEADQFPGGDLEGFTLSASEENLVPRLIDSRLRTALHTMPPVVELVWAESDWVVAALPRTSKPSDWDDTLAPLAMVADVAHALPARGILAHWPDDIVGDPTRALPAAVVEDEAVEMPAVPVVVRPETPPVLPTRAVHHQMGHVPLKDVGGDELEPIASSLQAPQPSAQRLVRNQPTDSSIFHDADERPEDVE